MKRIICALVLAFSGLATIQAHRLTVDWILAEGILEIRAEAGTEPAAGAELLLRDASGVLLAEGVLDDAGRYRWPMSGNGSITIEIHAGLGHRRTLTLSEEDLRSVSSADSGHAAGPVTNDHAPGDAGSRSGSTDASFSEAVRVGLGLTFLLALAAAWMGYRNSRRLAELEHRLDRHES
jgi:hypothetical protein